MEKKTIGKFISALRKANGMTQKEFGEKLFVSDKTVSRWECDECTPELSLIPAIAEIFGITADELLRGERNNPEREAQATEETATRQKPKSDRQFKLMLHIKDRKYKNLSLISVGITIFGFLAAVIANSGFHQSLLAFCLATAFGVASEICQICFATGAWILADEDDDTYTERIKTFNTQTVRTAVKISFFNILLIAFCLPLVTLLKHADWGMLFEEWLGYGLVFSVIALLVCYVLYSLFVRKLLCDKGLLTLAEQQKIKINRNNKLLIKTVAVAVAVALFFGICIVVWNIAGLKITVKKHTFENCDDFKAFMESSYDKWLEDGGARYGYVDENGVVVEVPINPGYTIKTHEQIKNADGEIICKYYYNPDLYRSISFTESADDKMPVTVITWDDYSHGRNMFWTVESILYALIVVDFVVATGIYIFKVTKRKKILTRNQ